MTNTYKRIAPLSPYTVNIFVLIPQWGPVKLLCPSVCLYVCLSVSFL